MYCARVSEIGLILYFKTVRSGNRKKVDTTNMTFLTSLLAWALAEEEAAARRRRFLYFYFSSRASPTSYLDNFNVPDAPFSLDEIPDVECRSLFRFAKDDIYRLQAALRLQETISLDNDSLMDSTLALCILLRRLVYPNRLEELVTLFRRSKCSISRAFHAMLSHIFTNYRHTLEITPQNCPKAQIDKYCEAIFDKNGLLERCIGFIDGTLVGISRPSEDQESAYNGHKRKHGLKFQSITTPDGLLRDFAGPWEGVRHDSAMLVRSNVLDRLRSIVNAYGHPCYVYGDPAYPLTEFIVTGFRGVRLTPEQNDFNREMSALRISVEWGFAILKTKWAFINFSNDLQLHLNCPGKIVMVAAILTNAHTCLYGNQVSTVFGIDPPALEEYLRPLY